MLELNASDERCVLMFHSVGLVCPTYVLARGIDVVRNKIKAFAQKKVTLPPGRHKIVILDEADRCVFAGDSVP